MGAGLGHLDTVSENRRGAAGLIDPALPVLRFDTADGTPLAVLYGFGCHPVSLHSYRNLLSPDYPGYARKVVRRILGCDAAVMFCLGPAGDVNPAGYRPGETTPERSAQIGTGVGCAVAKVALVSRYVAEPTLALAGATLQLPVAELPPEPELITMRDTSATAAERARAQGQPWVQISELEIKRDWAIDALRERERGPARTVPCELTALRIGEALMVAMPLEVFTRTGLDIRSALRDRVVVISTNSNGGVGYLPTEDAYRTQDDTNPRGLAPKVYGVYALAQEAEPLVRERTLALLRSLA
jgi:hypothetical protein